MVQNFNPEPVSGKFEIIFKNLNEFTWVIYNTQGVKTAELQYVKVKQLVITQEERVNKIQNV